MKNNFNTAPSSVQSEFLSIRELACVVYSSRKNRDLFQPWLNVRKLLHHLVHDELAEVSALLAQDLNSLFVKTFVKTTATRLSGTFNQMSPFDYIVLALDNREFEVMLSCLPKTINGSKVAEKLRTQHQDPVHQLLLHVVRGKHHDVCALLTQDIHLLYKKSSVIDLSDRLFEGISPFAYVLWALDSHMWNAILKCVSKNEQKNTVLEQLRMQYQSSLSQGLTYRLNGTPVTESHFDFQQTIIKELQTHVNLQNASGAKNWNAIDMHWRERVGGAQRLLPVHVVNEYCSKDRLFYPIPDLTIYPGPSTQFNNSTIQRDESWFKDRSRLGVDFGIYKGSRSLYARANKTSPWCVGLSRDLDVMTTLHKVRTNDFINLAKLLGVTPDDQPLKKSRC